MARDTRLDAGLMRRGLKIVHLRLFAELAASGQVSAAASALAMSQPAASRLMAEAERICGARLHERTARGVVLTTAGEAFASRARRILLEIAEADREIVELGTGDAGTVNVGTVTGPAVEHVMPVVRQVRLSHPGIRINVEVATSDVLGARLADGDLDFFIGRLPAGLDARRFVARYVGGEPLCLLARRGHPALRRRETRLADLVRYDWVFPFEGTLLRRSVERTLVAEGITFPRQILSTSSTLLTLVAIGQTNAIAPMASVVGAYFRGTAPTAGGEGLAVLPCDTEFHVEPYALIAATGRPMTPAAGAVYAIIAGRLGLDAAVPPG
jgi:DNA-binding transcriptional LysR family regulator